MAKREDDFAKELAASEAANAKGLAEVEAQAAAAIAELEAAKYNQLQNAGRKRRAHYLVKAEAYAADGQLVAYVCVDRADPWGVMAAISFALDGREWQAASVYITDIASEAKGRTIAKGGRRTGLARSFKAGEDIAALQDEIANFFAQSQDIETAKAEAGQDMAEDNNDNGRAGHGSERI